MCISPIGWIRTKNKFYILFNNIFSQCMKIHRFDDPQQYCERIKKYLLQNEAEHCLILKISNTLIRSFEDFIQQPYLVVVEDETILAVGVRTPPSKLVLSKAVNTEAIALIAQDLYSHSQALPGVIAPATVAKTFADLWQVLTSQTSKIGDDAVKNDEYRLIDRHLSEGSLYLWQVNIPVSMADFSGATPNGIRINLVYTPPK